MEKEKEIESKDGKMGNSLSSEEILPLSWKLKYLTAAAIFFSNATFGCAFNTYGPAITSFENKYDVSTDKMSVVFTILTGSYMVGALTSGIVYNYVNRQFAVITLLTIITGIMFVTPHCPTLTVFFVLAVIMGLCSGAYDCAQFVWMMEMMQKDCPPYVQSQHFFYALGTNLASLLMAAFLDKGTDSDEDTTAKFALLSNGSANLFADDTTTEETVKDPSKLVWPYTIVGIISAIAVLYHLILFIFMRYRAPPPEDTSETQQAINSSEDSTPENTENNSFMIGKWPWQKFRLVVLSCCCFGAYQGMEMCTFQFYSKFAQNSDLHLSESEAAYVLTGMTAAFAVGRGIAIVAVFKIATNLILWVNTGLDLIANIIFITWAKSSLPMMWTSSILFGFGFSSMYPSFCAYLERYLNFTNFIGSLMVVCGSGVAALYPLIVGQFIEENPIVLSYTSFFSIGVICCAFGTICYLTYKDKTRY